MIQFTSLPPLSLYIHFPWCVKKCPYCDFNSHQQKSDFDEQAYIDCLLHDVELALPNIWGRSIHSVFMGGGTPSLFSPQAMDRLLAQLRSLLTIHPQVEITMEANPGTFDFGKNTEKFKEFRSAGINRLSIGVQSFNNEHLQVLGRVHDKTQALIAIETAQQAEFNSINVDLMYGLPQQSIKQALDDVQIAVDTQVAHISHYQLTIEPNTLFYSAAPALPNDDDSWQMQEMCQAILAKYNYKHYEISAYSRSKQQCTHNLNYWNFGDYLGIGAGAHSKISNAQFQTINREWRVKNPREYMEKVAQGLHIAGSSSLTRNDIGLEFIMNALRLTDGFDIETFNRHTGCQINLIDKPLNEAEHKKWITRDIKKIQTTDIGKRYLNDVMALFVPD
ncbi:Radical SAM family enzyme, similar to coproporphyrinogen III oxidase, oxygen-independent, clustered with nucleoside-triphosphatase RdgB [hydrothermal vent metagenome]|uniref:Radical SAM family enzyme, similar to coproporphyrinogen III oxidase, oxygen-independent, clustered with nucleoside-triphosphatase RdgB n=1 Tax=hydrothermal vent metagenome TaxID=652676 RepID=A0A3B1A7G0_9ZZZZ